MIDIFRWDDIKQNPQLVEVAMNNDFHTYLHYKRVKLYEEISDLVTGTEAFVTDYAELQGAIQCVTQLINTLDRIAAGGEDK